MQTPNDFLVVDMPSGIEWICCYGVQLGVWDNSPEQNLTCVSKHIFLGLEYKHHVFELSLSALNRF